MRYGWRSLFHTDRSLDKHEIIQIRESPKLIKQNQWAERKVQTLITILLIPLSSFPAQPLISSLYASSVTVPQVQPNQARECKLTKISRMDLQSLHEVHNSGVIID
jgi:hypothetical protein